MVEDYLHFASAELDESKVITNAMNSILFIFNGRELKDKDDNDKKDKEDEDNDNKEALIGYSLWNENYQLNGLLNLKKKILIKK